MKCKNCKNRLDFPLTGGFILFTELILRMKTVEGSERMLISIGNFSKICSVSVKTLRYYDKIGLLKPAEVDKATGYRYYDEEQLDKVLILKRLKRYGFSLTEINDFLSEKNKRVLFSKLNERLIALETEIGHLQLLLGELKCFARAFERTGIFMDYVNNYEVSLVTRKPLPVISSRQFMGVEEFGKYYGKLFTRIAREGIETDGNVVAVYYGEEFDEKGSDIEVAIGVKDEKQADRILDGGLCAHTVHHGSYANLTEAYAAVVRWINEKGYKIAAPPYEIYRKCHVDNIPVDEWETDIYFPISE